MAELDVQPFGISVCEESDRIIVTGSIPYRRAVPFTAKFNRLYVYLAASGEVQRVVSLDDSYEIPRHALAIGQHFVVCYGWTKYGKVVMVDESGQQVPGCYGSQVRSGKQSLYQPLSLCDAGENQFLVADYMYHRIHLVTHQLQFVRHLVTKGQGITFPRQICLDSGLLFVGTYSGNIGIYRIK